MRIIAPSILAANFYKLEDEINRINNSKAKWIHFDVMDGNFVPNISFGPDIFKVFKQHSDLFMDVHIMVKDPKFIGKLFADAGADQIVFHYEACQNITDVMETINYLKSLNVKVGVSIKPGTDFDVLLPIISIVDLVLIMSVEPGFGGQKFIPYALDKVRFINKFKQDHNLDFIIQIDGGIDDTNKELCYEAGVDCLVAGSYLFKQDDFNKAVESLL